jgi:signal transduction histidine kinase
MSSAGSTDVRTLVKALEHDVKNPVGNVLGYLDLLREDTDTPLAPAQLDIVQRIEQNCNTILRLLQQFVERADNVEK